MRRIGIVVAVIALCLACATPAFAAKSGVTGVVRSITTGKVIAKATVTRGNTKVRTNSKGRYTLTARAGTYTLSISKKGYLKTYQRARVVKGKKTKVNWHLTRSYPTNRVPNRAVTILGWNDLGMHCDQNSYKYMCILPPYNTLHVQLFAGEGSAPHNVSVTYAFARKTDSTLHTDFWTYAGEYGWNLAPNVGLTGNGLSGTMKREPHGYVATGIPITPYDDDGTWDPYGAATITVKNGAGSTIATAAVVAPVSTEMRCSNCHDGATADAVAQNILRAHDESEGTSLLAAANAGHPRGCFECHADNALGKPGVSGVPSLSYAIHKKHDGKVANTTRGCYSCHPGSVTKCLRGVMARAGKGCVSCHGTLKKLWTSINLGRRPWLDEPKCGTCHGAKYAENKGKLYQASLLKKSVSDDMDGRIYCEACHNGTHAEYVSRIAADAVIPRKFQGNSYWIYNCKVCHKDGDSETRFRGQRMHR